MVRVTLPGGQRAELWVPSGLASASAVRRLGREATRDLERRSRSLRKLGAKVAADHEKLSRARHRSLRRQLAKVLKADSELDERLSRLRMDGQKEWAAFDADSRERIRRLHGKTLVYPALALSSLPLFSIFGRHNFEHNLTLLIVLFIWLFGDEVTDLLSSQASAESGDKQRSDLWLYVSPAANLLAGWWLLHERQHEPLITGTASEFERVPPRRRECEELVPPVREALRYAKAALAPCLPDCARDARYLEEYRAVVDLAPYVAKDFELDLLGLEEAPALATVGALTWSAAGRRWEPRVEAIAARVELGKLYITLTVSAVRRAGRGRALLESVQVAWVVKVLDEASLARWV